VIGGQKLFLNHLGGTMASKIPCVESQIRLIPVTSFGRSRICHFGENAEVLISEKSKFCVLSEFGFWSWI
jgi:hypothetical protein